MTRHDLRKPYPFHASAFNTLPIQRAPGTVPPHARRSLRRVAFGYIIALAALLVLAHYFGA